MASIFEFESAEKFLLYELDLRKRRNEGYSLRAFARDLGVSASQLSEILRGRAGMSESMAVLLAEKMKLRAAEKKYWFDLVLSTTARNEKIKTLAMERLTKSRKLSRIKQIHEAQFRVVADWHHSAILEMLELKSFRMDPAWIAGELGIPVSETVDAILRLKKLNLIFETNGVWQAQPEAFQTFSETPSAAIQKYHQQILRKSMDSIENDALQDRQIQAMILAIPRALLPQFGEKMKGFLQECWEDLNGTEKDDLYALSIQMVPVRARGRR
jgi:uncharacterized protein (TIGR02147 family)